MFKIMVIDDDTVSNKKIEEFFKGKNQFEIIITSTAETAANLIVPPAKDGATAKDPIPQAFLPQLILVDITKITGVPAEWHLKFREMLKTGGIENVPIILLSHLSDPILIRGFLAPGVQDVFIKPIITSILDSTLNFYLGGGKEQPRKMIPIKGTVEMFFQAEAKEISEFDMKILTPKKVELNDFKPIYGDFFKWSPNKRIMGRCTDCKNDEEVKTLFVETFTFVGVPPGITKEIRVWLRNYYVAQKQKS